MRAHYLPMVVGGVDTVWVSTLLNILFDLNTSYLKCLLYSNKWPYIAKLILTSRFIPMNKCCALHQPPRPQRRIHGLQLPLNYQQVIGWFVFIATGLLNFLILIEIQFKKLQTISLVVFSVLYVSHIVSHLAATLLDSSEQELRKLAVNNVPEFDRDIHSHVIENGRCHLCNIYTSSRNTKHCSICNKCVDRFDHHCKWLNTCIGRRNYGAFLASVTTALLISACTSLLCLADIVIYFTNTNYLSIEAQNFINCGGGNFECKNSVSFLCFLIIFCLIGLAIACALLHLCCFHIYILILGVSTYEYVVRSGDSENPFCYIKERRCCRYKLSKNTYVKKTGVQAQEHNDGATSSRNDAPTQTELPNGEASVVNFISILINSELGKAKKIFLYDKNKIHPEEDTGNR